MELVIALIVTLVAAPFVRRIAIRLDIVDRPGPLKTHRSPVPYLGGIAVFLGLLVGPIEADRLALLLPYLLALVLGVADDAMSLTPRLRLGAEVVIGVVAALVVPGPALVKVATGVLVVILLNAVNLLDGQDGLAAGVVRRERGRVRDPGWRRDDRRPRARRRARGVPRVQRATRADVPR